MNLPISLPRGGFRWLFALGAWIVAAPLQGDDFPRPEWVARPSDLIVVEAETLQTTNAAWRVQSHFTGAYIGIPSGLKMLIGPDGGPGSATTTLTIPKADRYRFWVRYLDIEYPIRQWAFRVRLLRGDQAVASHDFDTIWLRATPEMKKRWNTWAYDFVWDWFEAELEAGEHTLELSKLEPYNPMAWRYVDCFAITADRTYEPNVHDWAPPLYAKVIMGGTGNPRPVLIHLWGGIPHADISKTRLKPGAMNGHPPETWLRDGDESPWVNIGPLLPLAGTVQVRFDALTGYIVPAPTADFALLLSRTPSEEGLIGRFQRRGPGAGLTLSVDLSQPESARDGDAWSRWSASVAAKVPRPRGRQPRKFPLITGLAHETAYTPVEIIERDLDTLRRLGFSGTANSLIPGSLLRRYGLPFNSSQCTTYWLLKDGCLNQPNWEGIRRYQAENLGHYGPGEVHWIKLMDEIYSVHLTHLASCAVCADRFRAYLRQQGFGEAEAAAARPVVDKTADPRLFWHTMRFRSQVQVDFLKGCTAIVRALRPDVDTIANATTELTSHKNLLARGTDWFALYRQQALTFGFVQDANAITPSQQTISFMMDVLRSACKYHNQPYGTYNMISRTPWDIGAKAFTEIGHGARLIDFYNWGPYHAATSDAQSHRAELYPVLSEFNHAVGAVEDDLLAARPIPSKVALLYSHTTDIWDLTPRDWGFERQVFGQELMCLYLLLRHLGYPLDILTEEDVIEGRAQGYEALFVVGSHLQEGVVPRLLEWARAGGILYLGAGAAERNQYNEPLTDWEAIGLRREPFVFREVPGHELQLPLMQVIGRATDGERSFEVVGGFQPLATNTAGQVRMQLQWAGTPPVPCATEIRHGAGRVLYVGFFPGTSYVRGGCIEMKAEREQREREGKPLVTWNPRRYPAEYRELFQNLLQPLQWRPPLHVSHYLVEGSLLEGPNARVLALANWSGDTQEVTVTLTLPGRPGPPRAAVDTPRQVKVRGETVQFRLPVGRGDLVVIPRR